MEKVYKDSLRIHRKFHGKLEVKSKMPIKNRRDLSLAYTPGVAQVSKEVGKDRKLAREYTIKRNTVAVISDGSAILGLGNLGPYAAMPVMEGKAALFKEFANIDAFPICLDTQDTEEIIKTVKNIAPGFGGINLEDFSAPRCFEIEKRLIEELDIPVMHDDQRGTATVVLAALINALKIRKSDKEKVKVVINGAGAAGTAVAKILLEYGFKNISVCDTKGLVYTGRSDLNGAKKDLAELIGTKSQDDNSLGGVLKGADIFIGVSAPGVLKKEMIKAMAPRPIVFAMANPVPEIMPEDAKTAGAFIVASGRSDFPNQINNVLAFPGIFRGALDNGVQKITNKMLIRAAENLAKCVKKPKANEIIPNPFNKAIVKSIARAIR